MARGKNFISATMVGAASLSMVVAAAAPAAAQAATGNYRIASQPLGQSLMQLSRQANVDIVAPAKLTRGRTAGAVSAESVDMALRQMLAGTGLTFKASGKRYVVLAAGAKSRAETPVGSSSDHRRVTNVSSDGRSSVGTVSPGTGEARTASSSGGGDAGSVADYGESEEIIVTAQKREERLRDVPVPVTAIRASELADAGQLRVQDYYTRVPGLSLTLSGNTGGPTIAIRGITTSVGGNPTAGVIIDDIAYGPSVITGGATNTVPDIDPNDLARVEVLRGPQGTLYGASSIGGLLKFVTVQPSTSDFSGRIQAGLTAVSHGSDLGYSARAGVNLPLSETIAIRVSGFRTREPGYVDNVETGERDVNRRESQGFRAAALWRPSSHFSLTLSALVQNSERDGVEDVDRTLGGFRQRVLTGTGLYKRKTEAYSAIAVGEIGGIEITSLTGLSYDNLSETYDLTTYFGGAFVEIGRGYFPSATRAFLNSENNVKKFSQEIRATSQITDSARLLIGGFYTKETVFRFTDNLSSNNARENLGTIFKTTYQPAEFSEHAIFGTLTVDFTDRFDVQVGGRYSKNKQAYQSLQSGPFARDVYGVDPYLALNLDSEGSAFTYLLTPRFKLTPDVMIYGRFASGYRPGGPNPTCGVDPSIPCRFDADTTRNYDLGIKGAAAGGRFTYDLSVYYIDWQNIQIPGLVFVSPANLSFTYTGNVSKAESKGVEISTEFRPVSGITLFASGSYNSAQLAEDFPAGSIFGRSGDRLPYSPRWSGSMGGDWSFPINDEVQGSLGATISYVGDRRGAFQSNDVRQYYPSYSQVDLRAAINYSDWQLSLFLNNLTDTRGALAGGIVEPGIDPNLFYYTRPRNFGVSLARSF